MKKISKFIIMKHCIACTTCSKASPEVFALNKDCSSAIVISQPLNSQTMQKSFQALKSCPVSAIGIYHDNR